MITCQEGSRMLVDKAFSLIEKRNGHNKGGNHNISRTWHSEEK